MVVPFDTSRTLKLLPHGQMFLLLVVGAGVPVPFGVFQPVLLVPNFKLLFIVLVWIGASMVLFRLSETVLLVPQELLAMVVRV